jgi:hypothetical protein
VKWVDIKGEAGGNFRRDGNIVFECPPEQPITGPGFEPPYTDIRSTVVTTLRNYSVILREQATSCIIKLTLKRIRF